MKRSEKVAAAYAKFTDAQGFLREAQARETMGNKTLIAEKILAEADGHARVARHGGTPVDEYFRPTALDQISINVSKEWIANHAETVRLARVHVALWVKLPAYLQSAIANCDIALARFQERFAGNPGDALSWGGDAFQAAARRTQQEGLLRFITSDRALVMDDVELMELIKSYCMDELIRRASSSSRSTSPTSNLMEDETRVAAVKVWEVVQHLETGYIRSW